LIGSRFPGVRSFVVSVIASALVLCATSASADVVEDGETVSKQVWHEPDPSWQVNTSLSGNRYSIQNVAPSFSTDGTGEDVDFTMTRFLSPLRDDGAPYSLEPFLQRTSTWSVSLDGNHFSTHNPFGGPDRTEWGGGIGGSFDVYVRRWLALNGGLGYGYSALNDGELDQRTHSLNGFVEVGLRVADTRFDAWYTLDALDVGGSTSLRRRYGASAYTAIARRLTMNLSGNIIPAGERGSIRLEYYATRELGIYMGALAGTGKLYSNDVVARTYGGWLGVAAWIEPTLGILGEYDLTFDTLPEQTVNQEPLGYHEATHALTLAVFARFDQL
jgi:hypothetical protein